MAWLDRSNDWWSPGWLARIAGRGIRRLYPGSNRHGRRAVRRPPGWRRPLGLISRLAIAGLCGLGALCANAQGSSAQAPDPVIALVGGTIIDGRGGMPRSDATIVIIDGRIAAIGPRNRVTIPPGARQIDVGARFITPGFIDANVHLTPCNSFDNFGGPDSLLVLAALKGAHEMLGRIVQPH